MWPFLRVAALLVFAAVLANARPASSHAATAPANPPAGTWTYLGPYHDGTTWPPAMLHAELVYDSRRHRFIALIGIDGSVWSLKVHHKPQWKRMDVEGESPPPLMWHSAIYDPIGNRVIVQGGQVEYDPTNRMWALNLAGQPRWEELQTYGELPERGGHAAMIYDPIRERILRFGGTGTVGWADHLYEFRLDGSNTWRRLHPLGTSPGALGGSLFLYDSKRDRFLLFGGRMPYVSGNLYEYLPDGEGEWRFIETEQPRFLIRRSDCAGIYDPLLDRIIIHGGYAWGWSAWALQFGRDSLVWQELEVAGLEPTWRAHHAGVLDPRRRCMLIWGDHRDGGGPEELWMLEWPGPPRGRSTPVPIARSVDEPLEISEVRPLPGRRGLEVAFRGVVKSNAQVDAFDIAGRRVASARAHPGEAGVRLPVSVKLAPGYYVVRVRGAEVVTRGVMVR